MGPLDDACLSLRLGSLCMRFQSRLERDSHPSPTSGSLPFSATVGVHPALCSWDASPPACRINGDVSGWMWQPSHTRAYARETGDITRPPTSPSDKASCEHTVSHPTLASPFLPDPAGKTGQTLTLFTARAISQMDRCIPISCTEHIHSPH